VLRLLVTVNVVPSLPILLTIMMGAILSSETSLLTRATLTSQKTAFFTVTAVKTSNLPKRSVLNKTLIQNCDNYIKLLLTRKKTI
jgi:hypothetical protein